MGTALLQASIEQTSDSKLYKAVAFPNRTGLGVGWNVTRFWPKPFGRDARKGFEVPDKMRLVVEPCGVRDIGQAFVVSTLHQPDRFRKTLQAKIKLRREPDRATEPFFKLPLRDI